jgi:hypothetical protein
MSLRHQENDMANNEPTYFLDDSVIAIRGPEVPDASFINGMNAGGSCAPGIGIGENAPNVAGTPEQFTLLDQYAAARTPQDSQAIGGEALGDGVPGILPGDSLRFGANDAGGDGTMTGTGNATLASLAAGWTAV